MDGGCGGGEWRWGRGPFRVGCEVVGGGVDGGCGGDGAAASPATRVCTREGVEMAVVVEAVVEMAVVVQVVVPVVVVGYG